MKTALEIRHEQIKAMRFRGQEIPPQLAALAYLQALEAEMILIRSELDEAWEVVERRDFRKCSHHMDRAQQRLHRLVKWLKRKH